MSKFPSLVMMGVFVLGFAVPAMASPINIDLPRPPSPLRCLTYFQNMEYYVGQMEDANDDMDEAYNSRDMEAMVDASQDYDEARSNYTAAEILYVDHGCEDAPPEAPPKWAP